MMSIEQYKKNRYVISRNPFYLEAKQFEGLDIDTIEDFKMAKFLFKNKKIMWKLNHLKERNIFYWVNFPGYISKNNCKINNFNKNTIIIKFKK